MTTQTAASLEPGSIQECPGCHTRIVVRADLTCPACQVDMRGVADDGRRRLTIGDGAILPPVCAHCGAIAEGVRRIDASRAVEDGGANRFERALVGLWSVLFSKLRVDAGRRVELGVDVPVCSGCWQRRLPRPKHVNFDRGTVTLLVHRNLSDAVDRLSAAED